MKGLELSRAFWEACGRPMLEERFPDLLPLLAVGLVGPGSECWGYDDALSADHDFEPGFCVFLPEEDLVDRRSEFLLERAYNALPRVFRGVSRGALKPAGGNRHGVFRTADWYAEKTGLSTRPVGWKSFAALPDQALAEVTNGAVFLDEYGEFTAIREAWLRPPGDLVLKKLCGFLLTMSQTGEYNHARCLLRGDAAAAHLTADEFVKACVGAAFWAEGRAVPYYKWEFRALRELPDAGRLAALLEKILLNDDPAQRIGEAIGETLRRLHARDFLPETCADLQRAAFLLQDRIVDSELRNLSPLALA